MNEKEDPEIVANTQTALLLGIAYAANIVGVGALFGSPPNALLAAYAQEQLGIEISFVK